MFWEILKFEILYRIKRPATYAYFAIMLLLCMLFVSTDAITIGGGVGLIAKNAPFVVYRTVLIMNIFGTLICSAMMGVPIFRDFDHQIHEIYYSTPVSKKAYWYGKFVGSYLVTVFVLSGILIGIYLGTIMPWVEPDKIAPFNFMAYWQPFVQIILPNSLLMGCLFFASGALSRSMLVIYIQGIAFLVLYLISNSMISDIENSYAAALTDPIGLNAFSYVTKYWTPVEKNSVIISWFSVMGLNRLIWLMLSFTIFLLAYRRFAFSATAPLFFKFRKKNSEREVTYDNEILRFNKPAAFLPVSPNFNFKSRLIQWWAVTKFEFKTIVISIPFLSIVFLGIFSLVNNLIYANKMYGLQTFPVSVTMADMASDSFGLFMIIIIVFYTGELVWRERSSKINQIADALPIGENTLLAGKFTAMTFVLLVLQTAIMLTGMVVQAIKGYYNFQPDIYLKTLFVRDLWSYLVWACVAFLVHTLANNKFMGHGIVILLAMLITIVFSVMGWNHNLYLIGGSPSATLSDMNGFGHFWKPNIWFASYWLIFGGILLGLASKWWVRSTEFNFKARLKASKYAHSTLGNLYLVSMIGLFFLCGSFIYYNTNILNEYQSKKEREKEQVAYEQQYKRYENTPQVRIQSVKSEIAIFPDQRRVEINGRYLLKNIADHSIDTVIYMMSDVSHLKGLDVSIENAEWQKVIEDEKMGFFLYKLKHPLNKGDSLILNFSYEIVNNGFENDGGNTDIVYNGTFFNSFYMPLIGYQPDFEMNNPDDRRKYKLPHRLRMYAISDTLRYQNQNYISAAADWVNYETTVSTSADQTAIAPGYLQEEWTKDNRRFFKYSMDSKILNFYSYLSARYEIKRDKWNDVNIEIYYHKTHAYNLDKMIESIKHTLDYCTKEFGPYQHKQVRILEFPGYSDFAQSFPNTIPYSEGIGFVLDIDPENSIDMTYYITSHEVAHQWWAHQVIGSAVQGSTVMSESLSQYTAVMVMRQKYGEELMRRFLKYELDRYLRGRGVELEKEHPLLLNENQQYIHYQKGTLSMYALQDYIGEAQTNKGIKEYLEKYKFGGPPYSNSYDFYKFILNFTPDSLKTNVDDLFTRITLFDNQCKTATYEKLENGQFKINLTFNTQKIYADSLGNEHPVQELNEWIDIGAINDEDKVVFKKRYHITQPEWEASFTLDFLPEKAGIDPMHKLIDRNLSDNLLRPLEK